ncbi:MAG: dihydroorotate dehydrogenase electron transfer subunit [Candidatus Micrarchaeota archaeon]
MEKSVTSEYKFPRKIPIPFTISKIEPENYRVKTFFFKEFFPSKPGQFAMIWLPGIDEKPMSINSGEPFSISFAAVGEFSNALSKCKVGDKVGVSGPYGTAFELKGKNILLVGGGYGVVPLRFLAQEAKRKGGVKCVAIVGAKTEKDLLFEKRLEKEGCRVLVSTDDGSKGFKGNAVQLAEKLISENKFDVIYSCGPEKMMFHLSKLAKKHNIPCFVSAERYMKCGIGICGACTIGGLMSCKDGPVIDAKLLEKVEDWGNFHRGKAGRKEKW